MRPMDVLLDLDNRLFRAFRYAADSGSFTLGASKAGMTQSGMSQQIAKLETQVGVSLFERVNKKVLLTPEGKRLRRFISKYTEDAEELTDELRQLNANPSGLVRYGMPASCLKTPHLSLLLQTRLEDFPKVELGIRIIPNDKIFSELLDGNLDFGFVTKKSDNPAFDYKLFCQEEYIAVSSQPGNLDRIDKLTQAPFVDYSGMSALFGIWRAHHFPKQIKLTEYGLNYHGRINHLDGALTLVRNSVGASFVPRHCVQSELDSGTLHELRGPKKKNPVGDIFIATRKNYTPPKRVDWVIETFWKMKQA